MKKKGIILSILFALQFLSSACNTPRHALKSYYNLMLSRESTKAEKYLGESCKNILKKDFQLSVPDAIANGFSNDIKRVKVGKSQRIGDTTLVAINFIKFDGYIQSFDKNQAVKFADGSVKVFDFRYRLYKEKGRWKINLPYCQTKMYE